MTRPQLLVTITVMLGVIMAIIDVTIVNVALPTAISWTALAAGVTKAQGVALPSILNMLNQNANVMAYDNVFRIGALLFIAALPILFLVGRKRTAPAAVRASESAQPALAAAA